MIRVVVGFTFEARGWVVRKWLVAPESSMAQHLTVSTSVEIVFRSVAATKAYLRVGIELVIVGKQITSSLNLTELQLLAPNRQKGGGYEVIGC